MLHPDHARVQAALRGDSAAAEWLAERLTCIPRMVHQIAGLWTWLRPQDREDVAQDVALVVLRRLDSYHGRAPLEAWVWCICVLTIKNRGRQRNERGFASLDTIAGDDAERPEASLLASEHRARIRGAVDAVGGVEAEVLRQKHFDGLDFETIAARTGIGIATLRTRYYRALKRLQRRLSATLATGDTSP